MQKISEEKKQFNIIIGRRIRKARLKKKLSQKQLAELVNVPPKYLSNVENGHSGISHVLLMQIGEVLGKGEKYFYKNIKNHDRNPRLDDEIIRIFNSFNVEQKKLIIEMMQIIMNFDIEDKQK